MYAQARNVAPMRNAVVAFAGEHVATRQQLRDIAIVVSEALTNAVLHAYDEPHGRMAVQACVRDATLLVEVCDEGRGLPATGVTARLGLAAMTRIADRIELQARTPDRGLRVTMAFAIGESR